MPDPIVQWLLSQGALGIVVLFLLYDSFQQRSENKSLREAHKVETASERKLNADLQEQRVRDYKMLVEVSTSIRLGLEGVLAVLTAMKAGRD